MLLGVRLKLPNDLSDAVGIGHLGKVHELEDPIDVALDLNELRARVNLLIGA